MLVIGAGRRGHALLEKLRKTAHVDSLAVAERDAGAEGVALAREMGARVGNDWRTMIGEGVDLVVDTTGDDEVARALRAAKPPGSEIVGPEGARLLCELLGGSTNGHSADEDNGSHPESGEGFIADRERAVRAYERGALARYLRRAGGNVSRAAMLAKLPRRTFHRMIARHGISSRAFRN